MRDVLSVLWRELDHLLHAIGHLNTDHGIHGYLPARANMKGPIER